jgi:hypothetical protein
MADPKKPLRDPIAALLAFAVDVEQTPEEAEQELRAMGVGVEGFLARSRERRAKQAEEERTAWLTTAREGLTKEPEKSSSKYASMERSQMVAEYQRRQQQQAHAFFHKLDEISDDDLRTLLMDLDDLDDGQADPT